MAQHEHGRNPQQKLRHRHHHHRQRNPIHPTQLRPAFLVLGHKPLHLQFLHGSMNEWAADSVTDLRDIRVYQPTSDVARLFFATDDFKSTLHVPTRNYIQFSRFFHFH